MDQKENRIPKVIKLNLRNPKIYSNPNKLILPLGKDKFNVIKKTSDSSLLKNKIYQNKRTDYNTENPLSLNQTTYTNYTNKKISTIPSIIGFHKTSQNKNKTKVNITFSSGASSRNKAKKKILENLRQIQLTAGNSNKKFIQSNITDRNTEITDTALNKQNKKFQRTLFTCPNQHIQYIKKINSNNQLFDKILLKGKLYSKLKDHIIMNNRKFNSLNNELHDKKIDEFKKEQEAKLDKYRKKNNFNITINTQCKEFSKIRPSYRFEDYHMTPDEFFEKNFTKDEIITLNNDKDYFCVDTSTFSGVQIFKKNTLKDILNHEERVNRLKKRKQTKDLIDTFTEQNANYIETEVGSNSKKSNFFGNNSKNFSFVKHRNAYNPNNALSIKCIKDKNYNYLIGKEFRNLHEDQEDRDENEIPKKKYRNKTYEEKLEEYEFRKCESLETNHERFVKELNEKVLRNKIALENAKAKNEEEIFIKKRNTLLKEIYLEKDFGNKK